VRIRRHRAERESATAWFESGRLASPRASAAGRPFVGLAGQLPRSIPAGTRRPAISFGGSRGQTRPGARVEQPNSKVDLPPVSISSPARRRSNSNYAGSNCGTNMHPRVSRSTQKLPTALRPLAGRPVAGLHRGHPGRARAPGGLADVGTVEPRQPAAPHALRPGCRGCRGGRRDHGAPQRGPGPGGRGTALTLGGRRSSTRVTS